MATSRRAASNAPAWCLACAAASARLRPARGLGRQRGGTFQERGRGRQPSARLSAARRALELGGDVLVEPGRRLGEMPGAAIGIDLGIGRVRQRAMHGLPVLRRGGSVHGRADQRVTKRHARADREQPVGLRPPPGPRSRAARPLATPAPGRRPAPPPRPATAAGSRPGAPRSRRRKLSSIRPDSPGASSKPNPPASSAGVNPRGSSNNASGLPRVSATIRSRTRSSNGTRDRRAQQRARITITQTLDHQLRQSRRALRPARASPTPARPTPPTAAAPRTRAPAPRRDQATARHQPHTQAAAPRPTSASRLSTANPTRNRSGASPARNPNATPSASC